MNEIELRGNPEWWIGLFGHIKRRARAKRMTLDDLLAKYRRIAIAGASRAGKTTLSELVTDRPVIHTDDWIHLGYSSEVPFLIIEACRKAGAQFVVEGVQAARALRKGLPVDAAVWLPNPLETLRPEQERQRRGTETIWREIAFPSGTRVLEGRLDDGDGWVFW